MGFRTSGGFDVKAVEALSQSVEQWARYSHLAGESDNVETSPVKGTYDWKAYLQEEAQAAQKREDKQRPRKAEKAAEPAAAPTVYYV